MMKQSAAQLSMSTRVFHKRYFYLRLLFLPRVFASASKTDSNQREQKTSDRPHAAALPQSR
jgi:hypothetical protein